MIRKRSYGYVVEVYDHRTGKKVSVSAKRFGMKKPMNMKEARALERAALESLDKLSSSETVDSFAERWTEDFTEGRGESTLRHNKERIGKLAEDFRGRMMDSVTRREAEIWALQNKGRVREARTMWNDAIRVGAATDNPFTGLAQARKGRKDIEVLPVEEIDRLCDCAYEVHGEEFGMEVAALIRWAAYTGMRPGEIMAAKFQFLHGDTYDVREQVNTKLGRITQPKHGSTGRIYVPEPARLAVLDKPHRAEDGLMFHTKRGKRFSAVTLREAWVPVRSLFGRPDLDLYELRHFCASYMLNDLGVEPWVIAKQLRHSDNGKLVLELYGHPKDSTVIAHLRGAFTAGKENQAGISGVDSGVTAPELEA